MELDRHPFWLRYAAAVAIVVAALLLKLSLEPLLTRDEPVLLFLAAVTISAALGGLGPGLLAMVLAVGFDSYFFMEPFGHFQLNSPDQVFRLAVFAAEGTVISVLCARMKSAQLRAEQNAIEARELEGRLLSVSESEQTRIGRDLHDGLGQHLTGIGLLARRLQEGLATQQSPSADDAARLCDLCKTAVTITRELSRSLIPPTLERIGLTEALAQMVEQSGRLFDVDCRFDHSGRTEPLDIQSGVHLFRIAQEAVNNAVRHGRAKHVRIRLDYTEHEVRLQIEDDGVGIAAADLLGDGLGLKTMKYRARMIGGSISITRQSVGGTSVTCQCPLTDMASTTTKSWTAQKPSHARLGRVFSWWKTTHSSAKG